MDRRIKVEILPNKGKGLVATNNIPSNTIIIKELPAFKIPENEFIFCDIFQLLYTIMNSTNIENKNKFISLLPNNTNNFLHHKKKFLKALKNLSTTKNKHAKRIYSYFINNFTEDEIALLCTKYMCNAFEFGNEGPVILLLGTLMNHSCDPNVKFAKENGYMVFRTSKNIKTGEELCDNYINTKLPKNERQEMLKQRYGFICKCCKCTSE
ncbi:SET domain protein [Tupanvirus soda lake]|uniref:SET domain protein n=2 Tax=Tupanvirus TaxID=2094720 RepID=A0A6N1NJ09_9VIRU|nr:SET domain protein [Tupanvirus soda lake]QKU34879.1 SET domain protein [Tupanvirus soda lake]